MKFSRQRRALLSALLGGLWTAVLAPGMYLTEPQVFGPSLVALLAVAMVLCPLALSLCVRADDDEKPSLLYHLAELVMPLACAGVGTSFLFPVGRTAGLCAAPWLLFGGLSATSGIVRFYQRKGARFFVPELCIDIGMIYLFFAARWLFSARMGTPPPGVGEPMVTLTAIHFHYTFVISAILTGLLGRRLFAISRPLVTRIYTVAALGVLIGPILVATGINTKLPAIEVFGAGLLASSLFTAAVLTVFFAAPTAGALARLLLTAAAVTLGTAMLFAAVFAVSKYYGSLALDFPQMIRFHGLCNVLYALLSLLGWHAAQPTLARVGDAQLHHSR